MDDEEQEELDEQDENVQHNDQVVDEIVEGEGEDEDDDEEEYP